MTVRIIYMNKSSQTIICEGCAPRKFRRQYSENTFEVTDRELEAMKSEFNPTITCDF